MNIRAYQIDVGQRNSRSVLNCGSPLPLSTAGEHLAPAQSARGLAQSKTWRIISAALALLLSTIIFQPSTAHTQSYSIDWYKISGGGGTSTNGQYLLSGTI